MIVILSLREHILVRLCCRCCVIVLALRLVLIMTRFVMTRSLFVNCSKVEILDPW